jgi:hypothetical protein
MPLRLRLCYRWLMGVNAFTAILGLALVVAGPRVLPPYYVLVNRALWGQVDLPPQASVLYPWLFAVLGATIAGTAVARLFITHYPFRNRQPWGWNALVASYLVWFIPDTAASLVHGVWPNAVFNLFPFALELIPLLLSRPFFREPQAEPASPVSA